MIQNKRSRLAGSILSNAAFLLLSVACVAPIILLISISLSDNGEILSSGYSFLPKGFNLEAYTYLLKDSAKLVQAYKITIISTFFGTLGSMLCTILLAYVTSRENYVYKNIVSFMIFFSMLFSAGMVPSYIWITKYLHLRNNLLVLIIPGFVQAWYIILMRSFFYSIPDEITEAAIIDGCSEWKILFQIVLPLSKPALATVGLFTILNYFNDWQTSMLYMDDTSKISVQYFLYKTLNNISEAQSNNMFFEVGQVFPQEPVRMAMAVITILPIIVIFPFLQKYFVKGITIGAVKG